jgi:hypothetical protein
MARLAPGHFDVARHLAPWFLVFPYYRRRNELRERRENVP